MGKNVGRSAGFPKPVNFLAGLVWLCAACNGATSESVDASVCKSQQRWTGDDEGDPEMHPGHACITCHNANDGPRYGVAGTAFADTSQADDCFGLEGASIKITDANGASFTLQTNGAGNFFDSRSVALPYTASIISGGVERKMVTPQSVGDCNSCHTAKGNGGAPGRIAPL